MDVDPIDDDLYVAPSLEVVGTAKLVSTKKWDQLNARLASLEDENDRLRIAAQTAIRELRGWERGPDEYTLQHNHFDWQARYRSMQQCVRVALAALLKTVEGGKT